MKPYLRFCVAAAASLSAFAVSAADAVPRVVERVCSGCHGLDGNYGWPQVPRLAGQSAACMEQQLKAYWLAPTPPRAQVPTWLVPAAAPVPGAREERDALTFMVGIAKALDASESAAAAAWYAARKPAPGTAGEPAQVAAGKALFEKGVPAKGIPACQDCHGASGQGRDQFPRLAGQHADYLQRQIQALESGLRTHAPEMSRIAKGLAEEEVGALVAYLQSL